MMATQSDPMQGVYLEDSYVLGIAVSGRQLRLSVLFALTDEHPAYTSPIPGEQHCYREGEIRWDQVQIVSSRGRSSFFITADPDGTFDLGSVGYTCSDGVHHVATDWFNVQFTARDMVVALAT